MSKLINLPLISFSARPPPQSSTYLHRLYRVSTYQNQRVYTTEPQGTELVTNRTSSYCITSDKTSNRLNTKKTSKSCSYILHLSSTDLGHGMTGRYRSRALVWSLQHNVTAVCWFEHTVSHCTYNMQTSCCAEGTAAKIAASRRNTQVVKYGITVCILTIRYDTIGEFNVDWKAEYSALSSTRSQKKKLKQTTPVPL